MSPFFQCRARSILEYLDAKDLVTWEDCDQDARLLMVTNLWPDHERPDYGPFIKNTVEGVRKQGVTCDVMYIRGYRGKIAYLAGALACLILPLAFPRRYLLVHCHGGETALAARCFLGGPVLATYLGTDLLGTQVGGTFRLRAKCWLRSFVLRRHAGTMSATTTRSVEMETLLISNARLRNRVIPSGIDRLRFHPGDRDRARAELGWPSDKTIVLFAGRAEAPEKRLWLAQQVVDMASAQKPDIELRVVDGVSPSQMPLYYSGADCLLHTSVSEGSSNVVKEALACNLPVIATPAGDVRELLRGVTACAVCEPDPTALAGALVAVLQPNQRSNGREHTDHLSTEAVAKRTIECYVALGFPVSEAATGQIVSRSE